MATDTECFQRALIEYCRRQPGGMLRKVGDLSIMELHLVLRRAQELKDQAQRLEPERVSA